MSSKEFYVTPQVLPLDLSPEGALLAYSTENLRDRRNWDDKDNWE